MAEEKKIFTRILEYFNRHTIKVSGLKVLFTVLWSLVLNNDWQSCRLPGDGMSSRYQCTGIDSHDDSFNECKIDAGFFDLELYCHSMQGCSLPCRFGGREYLVWTNTTTCFAYTNNQCICSLWFGTDFVVICSTILQFLIQLFFYFKFKDFDPQRVQYHLMAPFPMTWSVFLELCNPHNTILPFLEGASITIAWFAITNLIGHPYENLGCSNSTDWTLDVVSFPIAITLQELLKPSLYLWLNYQHFDNFFLNKFYGLIYFVRLDIPFRYMFLLIAQMISCILSIVFFGFPFYYFESNYDKLCSLAPGYQSESRKITSDKTNKEEPRDLEMVNTSLQL